MLFNTDDYKKLTKEAILDRITEEDIFFYYISGFDGGSKAFKSELRQDKHPSCSIKVFPDGSAVYKDFGNGDSYDCFSYVQAKYGVSFVEALKIINNDFGFRLGNNYPKEYSPMLIGSNKKRVPREKRTIHTIIEVKRRPWNNKIDKEYWSQYYLTCEILNKFDVSPCTDIWLNRKRFKASPDNPFYCYRVDRGAYKILAPYSEHNKWLSNVREHLYQGYNQLPWLGDTLIITKSLKDVMVLYLLGYHAIAPQSEQVRIKEEFLETLKRRFKTIVIFYDNDDAGVKGRNYLVNKYDLPYIETPDSFKDISDFIKDNGIEKSKEIMKNLLEK